MIARHCHQESEKGEGVEVVKYEPCSDPIYGPGHYTEKRLHLYKYMVSPNNFLKLFNFIIQIANFQFGCNPLCQTYFT